jgi:hypothetical protein
MGEARGLSRAGNETTRFANWPGRIDTAAENADDALLSK